MPSRKPSWIPLLCARQPNNIHVQRRRGLLYCAYQDGRYQAPPRYIPPLQCLWRSYYMSRCELIVTGVIQMVGYTASKAQPMLAGIFAGLYLMGITVFMAL